MKRLGFTMALLLAAALVAGCGPDDEQPPEPLADSAGAPAAARQRLPARDRERWAIKTGADADAASVASDRPRPARVADLIALKRPESLPLTSPVRGAEEHRYSGPERTVYTVDADILRYKLEEGDHDFHLVIRDHGDTHAEDPPIDSGLRRTMIVESPDPQEVDPESRWLDQMAVARRSIDAALRPGPRFTYHVVHARITGVGFFDFIHGQSGVALNGIELHPVLGIEYVEEGRSGGSAWSRAAATSATPGGRARPPVASSADQPGTGARPPSAASGAAPGGGPDVVWVNLGSGVYWRPGSEWFGKTKRGEYLTETEAIRGGYRAAKPGP